MNWGILMVNADKTEEFLNGLFQEARQDTEAEVSLDFMSRVLADAEALQPTAPDYAPVSEERAGFLSALYGLFGGWQGASGLVAATMASVWIGFSGGDTLGLDGLQTLLSGDTDYYLSDFGGDFGFTLDEG